VLTSLLRHLRTESWFQGLEIANVWADGPLVQSTSGAARGDAFQSVARGTIPRAVLRPANCPTLLLDKRLTSRLRDLNRRRRRLEERGRVDWRWHREDGIPNAMVDAFLALEHMGWKGQGGSSLRSKPSDEAFFRELVQGFASQRRALFTELTLDGEPIASCCNLISGRVGFGFKIGWNPEFRASAPAKLNELELMRHAVSAFSDIDYFDSGAKPDSYINELWLERKHLGSLSIPTRAVGACALRLAEYARRIRHVLRNAAGSVPAAAGVESGFAT
jgi:CelD/BcsL family acetyltransferase involved in cellulose biosynthesis